MKLAKLLVGKPCQIQCRIEVAVNLESTDQTLIGPVLEGHSLLDMPTA